jgi:hypothetical protein
MTGVVDFPFRVVELRRHGPGRFDKVLVECGLGESNNRTAHPHLRIAPVFLVFGVSQPAAGQRTEPTAQSRV